MSPQIVPQATVFVVDDDIEIRKGVSRLAQSMGYSAKTFSSPADFLKEEFPSSPACVVLDMCMEGLNGLEVQDALRANPRALPVVFLSGHGTISAATAGIRYGAEDFLEKPVEPKVLVEAIQRAVEHDRQTSAHRSDCDDIRRRYDSLTPREQEVMALVVAGLLNKQVAAELGISEKTIKVHRARVMEKMRAQSLADLVRLAERIGIDTPVPAEYAQ